ncbi:hypothetical protein HGO34_00350 [Agrobacterium vitis]|uniref:Uncharacterized protein n=1 Tax=Agrobacterium vitis TaxID=373 RepID=A0AAE4W9K3_AGRVI|nr:hypothetical protein [Agrobacterium vitis]MCF1498718.1 hypothetical protein [Allorhizobium sp. Av2]MCM2438163.1 hypothetical protein [Agrobacterium vitis]MUZ56456.1 hypothetical protein [Agrobacterium vitis]MVA64407.1 hypothetical protein [Agrobacterium vitis]
MSFNVVILPRKASENVLVSFQIQRWVSEERKKPPLKDGQKPDCKWKENHASLPENHSRVMPLAGRNFVTKASWKRLTPIPVSLEKPLGL